MFTDWLDLMLYALQGRDDPYLDIVDKYDCGRSHGERALDLYKQAFTTLRYQTPRTNADLLGVIYETYGMASDAFGQYFTPHTASRMNAELGLDGLDVATVRARRDQGNPVTLQDPACGSGRLLVVAAQQFPAAQYWGVDKDATCAKMTALNFQLHNVDGVVVHGDSLALESFATWRTRRTMLGGTVVELEDAEPFADSTDSSDDRDTGDNNRDAAIERIDAGSDVTLRDAALTEFQ